MAVSDDEKWCLLAGHPFKGEPHYITNAGLLSFAKKLHPDFSKSWQLCRNCYEQLMAVYQTKLRNALKKRSQGVQSSTDLESLLSDTSRPVNQSKQPSNEQTTSSTTSSTISLNCLLDSSSENGSVNEDDSIIPAIQTRWPISTAQQDQTTTDSQSSLDMGPSTSAAAAALMQAKRDLHKIDTQLTSRMVIPFAQLVEDSDDDEWIPSPNAINGSRLPHIQPVLKRTQFVNLNKDIMDIYLAGTTGG